MAPVPFLFLFFLLLSGILSIFLFSWARSRNEVASTNEFSLLMLGIAIYSFGYVIEITRTSLTETMTALKLEYIGISYLGAFLFLFSLRYVTLNRIDYRIWITVLIIPTITMFLVFTADGHNLFYINPKIVFNGYFNVFTFEKGLWYYVHILYEEILSIVSIIFLVNFFLKNDRQKRSQILLIIVGTSIPIVAVVVYVLGGIPFSIDPSPFALALGGTLIAAALFKYGLFELIPHARGIALDSIDDSFLVIDKNGFIIDKNASAVSLNEKLAYTTDGVKLNDNTPLKDLITKTTDSKIDFEFRIAPTNEVKYYEAKKYILSNKNNIPEGCALLINDITETKLMMQKLHEQAMFDMLTGIYNRRYLIEVGGSYFDLAKRSNTDFGIILLDIDHFKKINDKYGHIAGDEILKKASQILKSGIRKSDILGRYGGEEFAIICPNSNMKNTFLVAERLRKMFFESSVIYKEITIKFTASFGVFSSKYNDNYPTLESYFYMADTALYDAKKRGRNRVCTTKEPAPEEFDTIL